ncbi:phosphotransferase enzyme family protein [Streptomyces sp. MNP-20]|uniref:phosphotransferase enzyme family protein n=1 Tax=Streptomyces sp. MNP-20 TaxID=2721165 RepID=UPI001551735F|nr:phosphotransferase [Streptomyces sp. MNP-20]
MREETIRGDEVLAKVLSDRYDVEVTSAELVPIGTETINRRVTLSDSRRIFVKQYRASADLRQARAAWAMSEFCRTAHVPTPRVWPNRDGDLLTSIDGTAWVVTDAMPGRIAAGAMTVPRAQHVGLLLGRIHFALASYPPPERVRQSRWRTAPLDTAIAATEAALARATEQHDPRVDQLRAELTQRLDDLQTHAPRLRDGLPDQLVAKAGHADFTRTNLLTQQDLITAVLDFQGETCLSAWELGRAAFDPRTVANSPSWRQCAIRLVSAYLVENPRLPSADVRACARVALLYLLFSLYGATTAEYELPAPAQADLRRHWAERQVTIRRLLNELDDIEAALAAIRPGRWDLP